MKLRNKMTGKIINGCVVVCEYKDDARFSVKDKPVFDSLDQLNKEWEDVKEPLIKDEKVRKAVRAWAEANSIKEIIIFDCGNNAPYTPVGMVEFAENAGHLKMQLRSEERFDTDRIYTIAELCGDEENEK